MTCCQFWIHSNDFLKICTIKRDQEVLVIFLKKILIGANWAILCLKMMHPHNLRSAQGFLSFHR